LKNEKPILSPPEIPDRYILHKGPQKEPINLDIFFSATHKGKLKHSTGVKCTLGDNSGFYGRRSGPKHKKCLISGKAAVGERKFGQGKPSDFQL